MPLYHFNVIDGVSDLDIEGTVLPNDETARDRGRRFASDLMKDPHEWEKLGDEWRIEITDHAGSILFRIDVASI